MKYGYLALPICTYSYCIIVYIVHPLYIANLLLHALCFIMESDNSSPQMLSVDTDRLYIKFIILYLIYVIYLQSHVHTHGNPMI